MKSQEIVDYLITNGDIYIKHDEYRDLYTWSVNRDGYDLGFEVEITKLIDRSDRETRRLLLTDPDFDTTICILYDSLGFTSRSDEILAKIKHSGVLE